MERGPDYSERAHAEAIVERAKVLLEQPDGIQMLQRYEAILSPNFRLEVRAAGDTGERLHDLEDNRYIYLNKSDHHCLFSLELNSVAVGKPYGLLSNTYHVGQAISETSGQEQELLRQTLHVAQTYKESGQVDKVAAGRLDELFLEFINRGSVHCVKDASFMFSDGTTMWMINDSIEGSLEHIWQDEFESPSLSITLENPDWEYAVVLEQARNGLIETYTRHPDPMEAIASYLDPEDVVRDEEDGRIIFLSFSHDKEKAIKAAERAAGIRSLDPDQLELIDKYLSMHNQQ